LNLRRKPAFLLAMIAAALVIFAAAHRRASKPPGKIVVSITSHEPLPPPPAVTLTDLNGRSFNTAELRGKVVVINFWAAWCAPCAEEVPQFIAIQKKYQDQGLQVVGISIDDSQSELRDFYRRHNMNYPLVPGTQKIAQTYGGILGLPTTLIVGRDGRVQKKFTGTTDFTTLEHEIVQVLDRNQT
jgi:peroxiredoxin